MSIILFGLTAQIYKIFSFCNTPVTFCVTDCCMYIYNFRGKMFHFFVILRFGICESHQASHSSTE